MSAAASIAPPAIGAKDVPAYPAPRRTKSKSQSQSQSHRPTSSTFLAAQSTSTTEGGGAGSDSGSVLTEDAAHTTAKDLIGNAFEDKFGTQDLAGQLGTPERERFSKRGSILRTNSTQQAPQPQPQTPTQPTAGRPFVYTTPTPATPTTNDNQQANANMSSTATPPSRKSILAGMRTNSDGDGYSVNTTLGGKYVSNTDAVLSQQRSAADDGKSFKSKSSRRTSVSSKKTPNGMVAGDTSAMSTKSNGTNGGGNRMSRLMRRATSREELPKENGNGAAGAEDSASIKSKSSFKRLSLKVPKFGGGSRGSGSASPKGGDDSRSASDVGEELSNGNAANGHHDEDVARVAAAGDGARRRREVSNQSTGSEKSPRQVQQEQQVPSIPAQYQRPPKSPQRGRRPELSEEEPQAEQQQQGYFGRAAGVLAGGAAAVTGVVGAAASAVVGNGGAEEQQQGANNNGGRRRAQVEDSDDEDEFHDADLSHISERSEESEAVGHRQHKHQPSREEVNAQRLRADEEEHGGAQQTSSGVRHRGQSAPPHALPPHHDDDASVSTYSRNSSRAPQESDQATTTAASRNSMAPSTTGTRKYAGSVSSAAGTVTTVGDAGRMKKETPEYVRQKAATVAKLKFDDCKQDEDDMKKDIEEARRALNLFLNSKMLEAEDIVKKYADRKLYYALGAALIAVIKGFMTFEPEDLSTAISFCKDTIHISQLLRKPSNTVANFGRFVRGTGQSPASMASMTLVQRHAELIYAEAVLLKAVMGILYSGDFFAFVSEALNMRNAYGIYRSLAKYVEWADEQASKKRKGAIDETIDEDFRSGVYLGSGLISMILGLLPGKVLKIMEVFGYTGDCVEALKILAKAGEWSTNPKHTKPGMPMEEEGIRRQICDMGILLYHLVISTFMPVNGVDINMADKILHYNLERYPQGIFFLYFSGRLYSSQALAEKAIKQFVLARDVQREYVQLQHICYWDMSLCHMSLCQWKEAHDCFDVLLKESNWSKAVYNYGKGANLYQSGAASAKEAARLISKTPDLMQRIAGKSIPLEKFAARKAKKFQEQGRLLLPALEFSYIYHCISNAPRYVLADEHLVDISQNMRAIHEAENDPSSYFGGEDEYWDDFCLAHFLRAVTLKYIAHPETHAKARPRESPIPIEEAEEQAEMSLKKVISNGTKLTTDHYLIYFAHYELGRLYAAMGRREAAKEEFNLILSGKNLGDKGRKGKYSMQNMCLLRSNGAINAMDGKA